MMSIVHRLEIVCLFDVFVCSVDFHRTLLNIIERLKHHTPEV
jgi:hypothetical protein